jgi:RNA polymerase sigma factor (sigma-70 family)
MGVVDDLATPLARADPLETPLRRYLETGDEAAMEEIVGGTRPRLLAAARRIGSPQDAEDAVQAAYLSLVRRRGSPFDAPVLAWLLTAVVRIAYRRKALLRRDDRIAHHLAREGDVGPVEAAFGPEDLDRLRREVARLPARYRDPVVLHHLQGLSTVETARLLEVPEATVRTRLRRARLLVRSRWSPRWVAAWMAMPWFVSDAWQASGPAGVLAAAGGGLMKAGSVVVVTGLVAAAAGAFVGSRFLSSDDSAEVSRLTAESQRLRAERVRLDEELARLRQAAHEAGPALRADDAAMAAAAGTASPPPAKEEPAAPAPAVASARARFAYPDREAVLAQVDWREVGSSMSSMVPVLQALAQGVQDGKGVMEIPEVGRIQQYNGPLVTAALTMAQAKVPGRGVNGAFTHPHMQVNAIAATLEAAGLPLNEAQAAALERVGREHAEADARRIASYDERTQVLQQILEEAEGRERFFEAAFAVLTQAQRDFLKPPATRDRLQIDLFSSGVVWLQYARFPMPFADRDTLVATAYAKVVSDFGIPEARWPDAKRLVEGWAARWPQDALLRPHDTLSTEMMMFPVPHVVEAARQQLDLQTRLVADLGLDEAPAKKIREHEAVWVPYHVTAK